MSVKEFQIVGEGKLPLFARLWEAEKPARALVIITHGHGEHCGRYAHIAEALSDRGFTVGSLDMRGHGHSGGHRGFIRHWGQFRADIEILMDHMEGQFSGLPCFLYGHSLGGTVCLDYAARKPEGIKGVIASAPALGKPNIPSYLFAISKILSRVYPSFSLATQLDQTALSRDPEVVRAYREDPLVHDRGTARLGTELLSTAVWIQANAANFLLPLLVIHGENDRLVDLTDSRRFFEHVGSTDKTLMVLPGGFHEPHNDLDKAKVIDAIGGWIENRL